MSKIESIKPLIKPITYSQVRERMVKKWPNRKAWPNETIPTKDSLNQFFSGSTKGWSEQTTDRIWEALKELILERGEMISEQFPEEMSDRLLQKAA